MSVYVAATSCVRSSGAERGNIGPGGLLLAVAFLAAIRGRGLAGEDMTIER